MPARKGSLLPNFGTPSWFKASDYLFAGGGTSASGPTTPGNGGTFFISPELTNTTSGGGGSAWGVVGAQGGSGFTMTGGWRSGRWDPNATTCIAGGGAGQPGYWGEAQAEVAAHGARCCRLCAQVVQQGLLWTLKRLWLLLPHAAASGCMLATCGSNQDSVMSIQPGQCAGGAWSPQYVQAPRIAHPASFPPPALLDIIVDHYRLVCCCGCCCCCRCQPLVPGEGLPGRHLPR
jgi:hypothetical protein